MIENPARAAAAKRQRACRARRHTAGVPDIPAFDRALREAVFVAYSGGSLSIDVPDLVSSAVDRLVASGLASERGCRSAVRALLTRASSNGGCDV